MIETFTESLLSKCPQSKFGGLRALCPQTKIVEKIGYNNWRKVIGWASSEVELCHHIDAYPSVLAAFEYYDKQTGETQAFAIVILENVYRKLVSFHGGGWVNSWANYHCARLVIDAIKNVGLIPRTSIETKNYTARRFVKLLNLEPYRYKNHRILYRLSHNS